MRRKSSTAHYQTFDTAPPRSRGRPLSDTSESSGQNDDHAHHHEEHPLPKKQLAILAVIALSEQTAFNSISPYLPAMAASFPEVNPAQVGVYVGTIASAFALAQLVSNYFWGWASDKVGRKPVILIGTMLTAACFVAFGFSRTLKQAIFVQALMGLVNGNQGVVSTCLGEITDRSNQSKAFTWLPVLYGLGAITGPLIGGVLVSHGKLPHGSKPNPYPYLLPNLVSAAVLVVDLILASVFLEESLEQAQYLPPLGKRVVHLFSWMWQFTSSSRPTYLRQHGQSKQSPSSNGHLADSEAELSDEDDAGMPALVPHNSSEAVPMKQILSRDTILLLCTYFIFQLANIAFNSLYPIFAQAKPPTGRNLNPEEIGLSLALAGGFTIAFQVGVFGRLRDKMGNRWVYRSSLALFTVAFVLMPWVGYKKPKDGQGISTGVAWLWFEIGVVLLIKTVAAVGGLTSALLLVGCIQLLPCGYTDVD